jgi:aspartyl-tRNA(Asn)/glutamyl-tRNA(Gln) amidotransferase subunit C
MISKEEVQRTANLARMGLKKGEKEKFQKELSSILDYIDLLKKVDTSEVKPTSHSILVENVAREDLPSAKNSEQADFLIKEAPETKGRHIKVKGIFQA